MNDNEPEIDQLADDIGETLRCLPLTIKEVNEKEALIDKAQGKSFWKNLTIEDAQTLLTELSPLMTYKRSEPRPSIVLDIGDVTERRQIVEYGPITSPKSDYVTDYQTKVERRIKQLAEEHPTIQKIKRD